ncbi:Periplasmic beta-glucosidase precursor [Rubripirellula obstinata]|uniref:Periplasmic beta-glucosidase n=1 Tax=Rubripirellula obstinata TaxID=406547 RepID=A0A5B1CHC4_9BACT|nr:glycoside hydrolase family 3 N-terminal domain-containing protein [Rubripirellula obstinata]KAA1259139.1 Periplasmic beta-glucosidase precursor [Rubripirellula obstinata]
MNNTRLPILAALLAGWITVADAQTETATAETATLTYQDPLAYQDPSAPIDERVEDLLGRMTLEEKVAQLNSISIRGSAATQEGFVVMKKTITERLNNGIGQIENTFDPRPPRKSVEQVNKMQQYLIDNTRLKIPALIGSECLHGHAGYNSTVFPVPLAMASSWNPELVNEAFNAIGIESRVRGSHEAHTPVLDLGRDPRWGRIEESYGEDTYLVSQMALAVVSGLQGGKSGDPGRDHIVSAPKHFAGYGQVVGGRNFAATPIETKTLMDDILPPFEVAVKIAGAQGMMASHCDVGGVPAHGNRWLLTELLRDQWGFKGMVVSDYMDIKRLEEFHHVAATVQDAARMALIAGMDLDLPDGVAYQELTAVIKNEPELESYLDQSVSRILRLKFMMGLFEDPFVDADVAEKIVGQPSHVALAEQLALESITLLRNPENILPLQLDSLDQIAVIGPNAASELIGNYTMQNDYVVSLLKGITDFASDSSTVKYQKGCGLGTFDPKSGYRSASLKDELPMIEKAVKLAANSGVAIVCVGGDTKSAREAFYRPGVRGDRSTLGLLGNQKELVMRVIETGTPTVVVLMGGRPFSIPEIAEQPCAILNTFYLGQTNGTAVAKVLFGEVNPSGKLPLSVPRSVGQLPVYYSQKATSFYKDYWEETSRPLFPFGHGLSYTTFETSNLKLASQEFAMDEPVKFSVQVKNTGKVAGAEVVQVYFRDKVASVVRPEKLLVRFQKVFLEPGQTKELSFELSPKIDLSFTGIEMERVTEPGEFELTVGGSLDSELKETFLVR